MSKYCPILTKVLESHQNQTYCLEEQCAWWCEGNCAISRLAYNTGHILEELIGE